MLKTPIGLSLPPEQVTGAHSGWPAAFLLLRHSRGSCISLHCEASTVGFLSPFSTEVPQQLVIVCFLELLRLPWLAMLFCSWLSQLSFCF